MDKILSLDISDDKKLNFVAMALSSSLRTDILKMLSVQSRSVNEIAFQLNISKSTASVNLKILEEAGLVMSEYQAGRHGSMKLCSIVNERLTINLMNNRGQADTQLYTVEMPIGGYTDFYISSPPCGLVTEEKYIGRDDHVASFYNVERFRAQLLWFRQGFVEYKFPKEVSGRKIESLEFVFEACAEAPGYRMEYPSDITIWVNGKEVGTWTCPGDYGGRRGIYTPEWWSLASTQFGEYKRWLINSKGSYLEGTRISGICLKDLKIEESECITFRIGIKNDAKNVGGINLFGEKFGDYPRNITMAIQYKI